MKEFVLGYILLCDPTTKYTEVMLLKKTHPEMMKDLLNGMGGAVEVALSESPLAAMDRETREEVGAEFILPWEQFAVLHATGCIVHCFACNLPLKTKERLPGVNDTGEQFITVPVDHLRGYRTTKDTQFLVPLALHRDCLSEPVVIRFKDHGC